MNVGKYADKVRQALDEYIMKFKAMNDDDLSSINISAIFQYAIQNAYEDVILKNRISELDYDIFVKLKKHYIDLNFHIANYGIMFPVTRVNFCSFCQVSTEYYYNLLNTTIDAKLLNELNKMEDIFVDTLNTLSLNKKIDGRASANIKSTFGKSGHNMATVKDISNIMSAANNEKTNTSLAIKKFLALNNKED